MEPGSFRSKQLTVAPQHLSFLTGWMGHTLLRPACVSAESGKQGEGFGFAGSTLAMSLSAAHGQESSGIEPQATSILNELGLTPYMQYG